MAFQNSFGKAASLSSLYFDGVLNRRGDDREITLGGSSRSIQRYMQQILSKLHVGLEGDQGVKLIVAFDLIWKR